MSDADKGISEACEKNDSLTGFKVRELKSYLASRRQNVSGNKQQLIDRVKGTFKLGISDVNGEDDGVLQHNASSHRFVTPSGEKITHPDSLDNWTDDYSKLPEFGDKDIYNYLVLKMNSQRHLKSKVFYEDGHVHKVQTSSIDENTSHLYIRATVIPSFPTADKKKSPDYRPWVLLSKVTGCVHSATCNCPAGEGESCNHIGALLYAVKDISNKVQDGKHSSTSQKCKWSNPRKRKLSPKKSQSVIFKKHKFESSLRKPVSGLFVKENATFTESTVNIQRLRNRLTEKSLNVGWLQNFPVHKEPEPLIPTIHKVEFMYRDSVNLESPECCTVFEAHFRNINISADDCQAVETMTRGQSSQPWKVARRERITSSFFGKVFKRKTDTKPDNLLKEMLYSDFSNKSTAYGKKHEKPARKMYVWKMNTVHKGLKVTECGLLVNQRYPHLGSSPDGLVYCPHCEESHGLVEIKCPASMKWRMITPEECCNDKDFFCSLVDGKVVLKQNHQYYYQVQGQMAVSGRRWCDFVVWTCAGLSVERITFNNKLWMQMQARLDDFYIKSFIPELYSLRVYRNVPLI